MFLNVALHFKKTYDNNVNNIIVNNINKGIYTNTEIHLDNFIHLA